jgi:hypothetical protein
MNLVHEWANGHRPTPTPHLCLVHDSDAFTGPTKLSLHQSLEIDLQIGPASQWTKHHDTPHPSNKRGLVRPDLLYPHPHPLTSHPPPCSNRFSTPSLARTQKAGKVRDEGDREDPGGGGRWPDGVLVRVLPAQDGGGGREPVRADGPHGGARPVLLRHHLGRRRVHCRPHPRNLQPHAEHGMPVLCARF